MKLFYSPTSPFVRKVMIVAHELGLAERIERLPAAAAPVQRDATIRAENPLGQVPTLLTADGTVLYDSRVIAEYLDAEHGTGALVGTGAERWRNLTNTALGDGMAGAALLARYEGFLRPETFRWDEWSEGQFGKVHDGLARIEAQAAGFGDRIDLGLIAFACALSYLDLRFADLGWRDAHPQTAAWYARFSERPSLQATKLG
jgi:glutathione S-transferase